MSIRSFAERMSRGVKLSRRLPRRFGGGTLVVSPEACGLSGWKRDLEKVDPFLFGFVAEFVKPGMAVWDIGANVGFLTYAAAFLAGPTGSVLAVEPDVENAGLLIQSRRRMDAAVNAPVRVLAAAVSEPG